MLNFVGAIVFCYLLYRLGVVVNKEGNKLLGSIILLVIIITIVTASCEAFMK